MTNRFLRAAARYFSGAGFPAFMILVMFFYQIFLGVTVFAPVGDGLWGKYVTEFRAWCFGYDSSTGTMRWAAAWVLLTEPVFLQGLILLIWRKPLFEMIRFYPKKILPHLSAALGVVTALAGGLLFMAAKDQARDEIPFPFPGERIRVALEPPEIDLLNQHQEQVKLSDYSGKVVLLTAVYATCRTSCPMILLQAKELFERLPEEQKSEVVIFAISLDPEADSIEAMSNTATAFGLDLPQFQFLNGEPEIVNRVLDQLSIARLRNPKTGLIDHANMFFLIDREGRIAFRFTLGDRHESWLAEALQLLLAEDRPADEESEKLEPNEIFGSRS